MICIGIIFSKKFNNLKNTGFTEDMLRKILLQEKKRSQISILQNTYFLEKGSILIALGEGDIRDKVYSAWIQKEGGEILSHPSAMPKRNSYRNNGH